jgi:hypothetical protein
MFDFESSHWPRHFYHTGPFHDGLGRAKVDFSLGQTDRPAPYPNTAAEDCRSQRALHGGRSGRGSVGVLERSRTRCEVGMT